MKSREIRLLLWAGCLGAVVLFAGDMLYYGQWDSGREFSHDIWNSIMASVPLWGGWSNVVGAFWFAVLGLRHKDQQTEILIAGGA